LIDSNDIEIYTVIRGLEGDVFTLEGVLLVTPITGRSVCSHSTAPDAYNVNSTRFTTMYIEQTRDLKILGICRGCKVRETKTLNDPFMGHRLQRLLHRNT
jgi:hypothetical protein